MRAWWHYHCTRSAGVKILVLLVMCVAMGCYSPSLRDCTASCANPGDCGGGQVCTDGWCANPDKSCAGTPDAAATDASLPVDARQLCELGCPNGTCAGGVCVIDCSAPDSCPSDVTCPPNVPCRIVCGDRSCDHKVACGQASTCEIRCNGHDACADEVSCGTAPCEVTCAGVGSCKKKIKCKESCACDVTCSGLTSCADPMGAECPLTMDACSLGKGCSSELAGCDRCE